MGISASLPFAYREMPQASTGFSASELQLASAGAPESAQVEIGEKGSQQCCRGAKDHTLYASDEGLFGLVSRGGPEGTETRAGMPA